MNKIAFVILSFCDIIILTYGQYLFPQFHKNWSDCPFDKYISTNFLSAKSTSFKDIKIGKDNSWSDGVIKTLKIIKNK